MFDVLYSTCVPFPSPNKDCAVSQTQKPRASETLSDVCHTAHFLISRHRPMLLMMLVKKKKSLVGAHEAHEIQAGAVLSGHINLMQHHVLDRPDLVPPTRPVRADDEMSVQEHETTHVPFTHHSVSDTIPSDVPVTSVELEDSVQTTPTRRITFERPPNPLNRVEPPKRTRGDDDDHSALLSAYHHYLEQVSENLKAGKMSSVKQGCLTCRTVLGLRSKSRLKHRKVKQRQKHSALNLCRKVSTICWSQSVFRWVKKQCSPDPETAFNVTIKQK